MEMFSTSGPRLKVEASTVLGLMRYAYDLKNYQILRTPLLTQVGETMYDIAAVAPGESVPTKLEFRQMMQSLLADRFKLRVHRETKEMPVYALVVDRNGPKLKESAPDADPSSLTSVNGRNYVVTVPLATMDRLVDLIANAMVGRPVVDKTGLIGTYDIRLTYGTDLDSGVSIFTAVQKQLGLRLVQQNANVEVLVVDHVEKPSEN